MDPLLTVRDEWELDHCDIKFGSVLGQGAFGKVMTGIYEEQKVAIKVLKGKNMIYNLFLLSILIQQGLH
jgi:hypothetical protein